MTAAQVDGFFQSWAPGFSRWDIEAICAWLPAGEALRPSPH